MEKRVVAEIDFPSETLARFMTRLGPIKRASPDLFQSVNPLVLSQSELYSDRVRKITNSNVNPRGAEPENPSEHPHSQINSVLLARLTAAAKKNKRRGGKKKATPPSKKKLPIIAFRDKILSAIKKNQVILIRGATGCGKTTQVPQFILDSFIKENRGTDCRIVCTQPRRVAAISIASRVAEERGEELGGESVGYLIRCDNELPRPEGGHILYCTVGVLLRQLQTDPTFRNLTHIIVDEVHERSVDSDILLGVLKILLPMRPDLRVIIMSATIEMDQFSEYFGNCPTLEVPGFNHEVTEYYLDDVIRQINMPLNKRDMKERSIWHSFITKLIVDIHKKRDPGAILVFCSGYDDIERLYKCLKFEKDPSMKIYILHSLVPVRRNKIFAPAKEGERKIILSTNVAESSITIDDVVYVVDNGKQKYMAYHAEKEMYSLQNSWYTKANAQQRKGRAGRCQDGFVFRLYDREIFEEMENFVRSDVSRARLDSVILDLLVWNFGPVKEFLGSLLSPPDMQAIDHCIRDLQRMNAVTENGVLTRFGRQLVNLHLDPQLGKMLIYASIFNCVDPITSIVAFLSYKDLFTMPLGSKRGRRDVKSGVTEEATANNNNNNTDSVLSGLMSFKLDLDGDDCSDHMVRVKAVQEYRLHKDDPNFCFDSYLNEDTMVQVMAMRSQIVKALGRNKFIAKAEVDNKRVNNQYMHMIRSVICAGLYPNSAGVFVATEKVGKNKEVQVNRLMTPSGNTLDFHKDSVNADRDTLDTQYMVYYKAVSTNKRYVRESTMVHSLALCLFAADVQHRDRFVVVDNFYFFKFPLALQLLIEDLRVAMQNIFNKTVNNPHYGQYRQPEEEALQLIADVLAMEEYSG